MTDRADFTRIVGLSDRLMLPRCGKVRLGEKRKNDKGKVYPVDLPYFKFDDEVLARYPKIATRYANQETGAIEPTELKIIFPVEQQRFIFPQSLRFYGRTRGLRCIGDGKRAERYVCRKCHASGPEQGRMGRTFDCACPSPQLDRIAQKCKCHLYDEGKCREQASLMFVLPDITWEGCWQLDTGSKHNIVKLNSSIAFIRGVLGRIALVPLTLRRLPVEITYQGKKATHCLLNLGFDGDTAEVRRLRAEFGSPAPEFPAPLHELPPPTLDGDDLAPVSDEVERPPVEAPAQDDEVPPPPRDEDAPPPGDDDEMPDVPPPETLFDPRGDQSDPPEAPSERGESNGSDPSAPPITDPQLRLIEKMMREMNLNMITVRRFLPIDVKALGELAKHEASAVIEKLIAEQKSRPPKDGGKRRYPPAPARR